MVGLDIDVATKTDQFKKEEVVAKKEKLNNGEKRRCMESV